MASADRPQPSCFGGILLAFDSDCMQIARKLREVSRGGFEKGELAGVGMWIVAM